MQHTTTLRRRGKSHTRKNWNNQPPGFCKLNSDAADFDDGTVSFGFVVRNAEGLVLMLGSKRCKARGDCTLLKALAMHFSLKNAIAAGMTSMQLETDSEILEKTLREDDIRSLAPQVQCNVFLFCKREANRVAHSLAHFGTSDCFENTPISCLPFLIDDVRRET